MKNPEADALHREQQIRFIEIMEREGDLDEEMERVKRETRKDWIRLIQQENK